MTRPASIRGGTVVDATERSVPRPTSRVDGGRIAAVEPDLSRARGRRRRARSSMRPGCSSCRAPSTSTRTPASPRDDEPDRFFQDSVAAAFGGTTTFLVVQQPGHRVVAGRRALAPDGRPRVARRPPRPTPRSTSALSLGDPRRHATTRSPSCPRMVDAGVPTVKAFMVFDFRLAGPRDSSRRCACWASGAGCSRSTARTRS